ncbi:MAG: (Fe-S)-binding protein [candidate division WOR-3 bacterium]|nr:MAG: (Fe-S)-binding protein [candidate division WOR-3 bacterium]
MNSKIAKAIRDSKAYLCMECGKCTGTCPVSRYNHGYSPRILVNKAIRSGNHDLLKDKNIWACLTCKLCDERCPAAIEYIDLTLTTRLEAKKIGEGALCSHGGAAQSLMRIMTTPELEQKRLDWIDNDLKTTQQGDVLYFVGCMPYFDILFSDIKVNTLQAARASVKILNKLGITPVVLPQERCCGHDLLWSGDMENFEKLARHNIEEITKSGAKRIVFSCPEGYRTFKIDYPRYFGTHFRVEHITETIARAISNGELKMKNLEKVVTFQDPCRLGRHLRIYDEPRKAITSVPGLQLNEMARSRQRAICCGVSAWMSCSTYSKSIQRARLTEAKETGADLFVLSCPKCEIHFQCAMSDEKAGNDTRIETIQLVTLIADALEDG